MKKVMASMILGTMIISAASMSFATAAPMEKIAVSSQAHPVYATAINTSYDTSEDSMEWADITECSAISFKDYMGDLLAKVSSTDKDQLEKHYNAAMDYEKEGKFDEADKEWNAFDKVMESYDDDFMAIDGDFEMPSYDDYMKESKDYLKTVDAATDKKMKALYKEAVKLDEAEKYEESEQKWIAFDELFEKFIDEEKFETCTATDCEFGDADDYDEYDEIDMEELTDADYTLPTYKEFMKDMSDVLKPVSDKDQQALETLYDKASKLEDEGKYDAAQADWDAFYKILDKYFKDDLKMFDIEQ